METFEARDFAGAAREMQAARGALAVWKPALVNHVVVDVGGIGDVSGLPKSASAGSALSRLEHQLAQRLGVEPLEGGAIDRIGEVALVVDVGADGRAVIDVIADLLEHAR